MPQSIFREWTEETTALWGRQPLKLEHTLHQSPLFTIEALGELIERYQRHPQRHHSLVYMGMLGGDRFWREGDIDGMSGGAVIEAISKGRFWLNLRSTDLVDGRYGAVLAQMFEEIGSHVTDPAGFPARSLGVLISSPSAQVYYHADLPNQSLWQVAGRKRVYVYPSAVPFLEPEHLERIAIYEVEVDVPYRPWYDKYAKVFDVGAGEMLHWPLNSPHRVVNYESLNVSITTEYWAKECQQRYRVNLANGALRYRFGMNPVGRATSGPGYQAKALMARWLSRTDWLKRSRTVRKPIDFRLDCDRLGEIVEVTPRSA